MFLLLPRCSRIDPTANHTTPPSATLPSATPPSATLPSPTLPSPMQGTSLGGWRSQFVSAGRCSKLRQVQGVRYFGKTMYLFTNAKVLSISLQVSYRPPGFWGMVSIDQSWGESEHVIDMFHTLAWQVSTTPENNPEELQLFHCVQMRADRCHGS